MARRDAASSVPARHRDHGRNRRNRPRHRAAPYRLERPVGRTSPSKRGGSNAPAESRTQRADTRRAEFCGDARTSSAKRPTHTIYHQPWSGSDSCSSRKPRRRRGQAKATPAMPPDERADRQTSSPVTGRRSRLPRESRATSRPPARRLWRRRPSRRRRPGSARVRVRRMRTACSCEARPRAEPGAGAVAHPGEPHDPPRCLLPLAGARAPPTRLKRRAHRRARRVPGAVFPRPHRAHREQRLEDDVGARNRIGRRARHAIASDHPHHPLESVQHLKKRRGRAEGAGGSEQAHPLGPRPVEKRVPLRRARIAQCVHHQRGQRLRLVMCDARHRARPLLEGLRRMQFARALLRARLADFAPAALQRLREPRPPLRLGAPTHPVRKLVADAANHLRANLIAREPVERLALHRLALAPPGRALLAGAGCGRRQA